MSGIKNKSLCGMFFSRRSTTYPFKNPVLIPFILLLSLPLVAQNLEQTADLSLTRAEAAWLKEHETIRLAVDDNNPPANYRDAQGKLTGIHIEYMERISAKLGIEITYIGSEWNTALARAMRHEVDGIINANITPERQERLNFTESYFQTPDALLSRTDTPNFEKRDSFSGKRIAIIRGSIRVEVFLEYAPEAQIIEVDSVTEAAKMVSEGRADAFLDELAVVQNLLEEYHLPNLKLNSLIFFPQTGAARVGLRSDEPVLLSLLNKAIAAITPEEHREIRGKYLFTDNTVSVQNELALTERERDWLAEHPVVRVGVDSGFAPIEFRRGRGEYVGLSMDYLNLIGERLNITFEKVERRDWSQLIELARHREIDMFASMADTPFRRHFLSFTDPYVRLPVLVYTQDSIRFVGSISELEGKRIGAVQGYAQWDWLAEDYPEMRVLPYSTVEAALTALAEGSIDAYVGNLVTTSHYLRELELSSIHVAGETDYTLDLAFAVRRDWSELRSILNKTLSALPESETRLIYQRWVPTQIDTGRDLRPLYYVGGVAFLVIVLVVVWNRSLGREIRRRNETLRELKETQEQLIQSEKLASLGTLVSGIAHELNNPLNFVTSGVAALEKQITRIENKTDNHEAVYTLLENIKVGAFRAADIVKDLREYSRSSKANRQRTDINECIRLALKVISEEYKEGIEIDFSPGDTPELLAFPGKLTQVFVNLLMNAFESVRGNGTSNGLVLVRTEREERKEQAAVRADVINNGTGIAEEIRSRIFDPFYTTKDGGTGLGLSISQRIIESHGGRIELLDASEGAHFRVYLPVDGEGHV